MPLSFFDMMAARLFLGEYKIGDYTFSTVQEYIEENHQNAEYKGNPFYNSLIQAISADSHYLKVFRADNGQTFGEDIRQIVVTYCRQKMQPETGIRPATAHSGTNSIPDLSMEEFALIYVYNREHVDANNAGDIAAACGFTHRTSGKKFKQCYDRLYNKKNRSGLEPSAPDGSETKNINKVKRIRKIIPHLYTKEAQTWAASEATTLESNIGNIDPS